MAATTPWLLTLFGTIRTTILFEPESPEGPTQAKRPVFRRGVFGNRDYLLAVVHVVGTHGNRDRLFERVHALDFARFRRPRRLLRWDVRHAQHDATVDGIYLHHLHLEIHRLVDQVRRAVHRLAFRMQLRDRNEPFDVVADIHDDTLVHQADDLPGDVHADRIVLTDLEPWIFLGLFQPE